jgi:hypothetical protein
LTAYKFKCYAGLVAERLLALTEPKKTRQRWNERVWSRYQPRLNTLFYISRDVLILSEGTDWKEIGFTTLKPDEGTLTLLYLNPSQDDPAEKIVIARQAIPEEYSLHQVNRLVSRRGVKYWCMNEFYDQDGVYQQDNIESADIKLLIAEIWQGYLNKAGFETSIHSQTTVLDYMHLNILAAQESNGFFSNNDNIYPIQISPQ